MILTVKINGTDRSDLINWGSFSVEDKVNEQPNVCNFTVNVYAGQSYKPAVGEEVIITDENSLKIFAGNILSIRHSFVGKLINYEVECKDYTSELDRIQVIDSFDNQTVTQIINYINTNYLTGITTTNVDCPIIIKRIVFNRKSVTECLNSLVKLTNYVWYIDYDKDIHFIAKNTEIAPFSIADNSQNLINDSLDLTNDLSQLRNIVIIRGGDKVATNTRDKDHTTDGVMTIFNTDYKFASKPTVGYQGVSGAKYKRTITIDNTKIDAGLTDFPVLVKLDSTNFDFTKAKADGTDILFKLSDGTLLKFERERHDSVNLVAEYWVKIPTVSSSVDTTFDVFYGDSSATDSSDAPNTWDSNYLGVYHLNGNSQDSTSINNGTDTNITYTTGIYNKAGSFDGTTSCIDLPAIISTQLTSEITISLFENPNANVAQSSFGVRPDNGNDRINAHCPYSDGTVYWDFGDISSGGRVSYVPANFVGTWQYFSFLASQVGSFMKIMRNGIVEASSGTMSQYSGTSKTFDIGRMDTLYFGGLISEFRISKISRSEAYEKANYNTISNTLLAVGSETTLPPAFIVLTVGIDNLNTTGYDCYWNYNEKYVRFDVAPTAGQALKITGNPLIPIIVQVENIASVSQYGRYEFSKVDKSLKSADDARLYAQAEIDSYGKAVREGGFRTYKSGLSSGQTISINLTDVNISDTFIIQSVSLNMLSRKKGEYAVEIATTQTMGIIKFLRDKLLNTKNIELNENDVLEKYYVDYQNITVVEEIGILTQMTDNATISVKEDILKDPFGSGVLPEFVLTPYTPTGNTDIKREFVLDRGLLS